MNMKVLEIKGIRKNFADEFQIEDINMDLYKGEVHVILGENGSGKSALMKIISGLYPKDGGTIRLFGKEVDFNSFHASRQAGIFYQHQDIQLFENLNVAENIYFDGLAKGKKLWNLFDPDQIEIQCRKLFDQLGLTISPDTKVSKLGYAQRQLLSAIKAYVSGAQVVIFDEPTAAMGDIERELFFSLLEKLKQNVEGIFYISHRMDEINKVGDRVSVMHKGHLVSTSKIGEIDKNTLVGMMIEDPHKERYPRINITPGPVVMQIKNLASSPILTDISFSLRKQEILGITGLMGSGRTLLSNCLYGLVAPDKGDILINGKSCNFTHPIQAMQQGISLIPENRETNGIFSPLPMLSNMTIASLHRFRDQIQLNQSYMQQLSNEYIRRLSIVPGSQDEILQHFSGGNKQKVLLARWFMNLSRIYIMDEPTRGVDTAAKVDIYNAINDLVSKGASVILFSSEIEEILGMCDRILVLSGGRIACNLSCTEATKEIILDYATMDS